jgi:type III pantothenate kinase
VLLTYDVGNTNIVVGLFDGQQLVGRWRFTTDRNRTGDELRFDLRSLLAEASVSAEAIEGVAVASVVPALNPPLRTGLETLVRGPVLWVSPQTSPIRLEVDEPWSVGADRIVDCVAGYEIYGGPLLIVDFGTAATFNVVSRQGALIGGAIAPEMRVAAQALVEKTAQLFSVSLDVPRTVIGKTTADNIRAGVVLGFLDLTEGLIRRFRAECGRDLRVVATGGKGELYHREIEAIELYDPDLTLKGLEICWRRFGPGA